MNLSLPTTAYLLIRFDRRRRSLVPESALDEELSDDTDDIDSSEDVESEVTLRLTVRPLRVDIVAGGAEMVASRPPGALPHAKPIFRQTTRFPLNRS